MRSIVGHADRSAICVCGLASCLDTCALLEVVSVIWSRIKLTLSCPCHNWYTYQEIEQYADIPLRFHKYQHCASQKSNCRVLRHSRMCQDVSFPYSPSLDCAFEG